MRRTNTITKFHKNAPKKLIQLYKKNKGNCYVVAKQLEVNSGQVWGLLSKGTEPKREDLRRKLFLKHKLTPEELEQKRELRIQKQEKTNSEIEKHFKEVMETIG